MPDTTQWSPQLRQYSLVTAIYWAFTLTDGALRMLVLLHFHALGYSPLQIAMLFLFYELFGVFANLTGGWLGARLGLNNTMQIGLALQVVALGLLLVPAEWLTVLWVMLAQALSGIAKDLNKMSAKSAVKLLVPKEAPSQLYRWVAWLTGSKNALKGLGFFLGAALLALLEFRGAIASMAAGLALVWLLSILVLNKSMGAATFKPGFRELLSKSRAINYLSAARMLLFCARDVWFVVALPVYLSTRLQWSHYAVGGFMAIWIIAYGVVQGLAPRLTGENASHLDAFRWALLLAIAPALMALSLWLGSHSGVGFAQTTVVVGLMVFGGLFAINSSLHSYLIIHYASSDAVSLDVGFYYMANAMGRLLGTVLSGWLFQVAGLGACLWVSAIMVMGSAWLVKGVVPSGSKSVNGS